MDYSETFGSVRDADRSRSRPRKPEPKTEIGRFYKERNEVITHWCNACRRWHGLTCFRAASNSGGAAS